MMERISILHLRSSGGLFGAEKVILNLADNCNKSYFTHHIVCINSLKNQHTELIDIAQKMGFKATSIDCHSRLDFKTINKLATILKENNVNIIHTHGYKEDFMGFIAAKMAGVKKIATVHGWTKHTFSVKIYELLDRFILRFFDRIIVVSDSLKKGLIKAGIPGNKIVAISNSIDVNKYSNDFNPDKMRTELNIDSKETIIGSVGRLSKEKGHKYLLYAAGRLIHRYPYLRFIIVGDGPEKENLIAISKELGIQGKVDFVGFRSDVESFFSAFNIFVLPSLREGLPGVLLEAFAHHNPAVATNVGGVPELVRHKETGFLVHPKDIEGLLDGIRFFLENPTQAKTIAENGYNLVKEKFSLRDNVEKLEELYYSLL